MSFPQYPTSAPLYQFVGPPPVQVLVAGAAPQRRLTVLVRAILAIPHFVVLFFLAIAADVVAFLGWWGALFLGRLPDFATSYLTGFIHWTTRVMAYMTLLTDAYPPFSLEDDPGYPVRIATTRERLNRGAVFFRLILMIPAWIVLSALSYGALSIVLLVAWVITLVTGRLPDSLHLAYTAVFRYMVRFYCYQYLLTPTYPVRGLLGDDAASWPQQPAQPGFAEGYAAPGFDAPPQFDTPQQFGAQTQFDAQTQAAGDPANWRLILTPLAKGLVVFFIVLGALLYVGENIVNVVNHSNSPNYSTTVGAVGQVSDNAR